MLMKFHSAIAGILFLLLFDNTGTINGTVLDRQHRPLPNALVVCTDKATGRVFKTHTDNGGHFGFSGLRYSVYEIEMFNARGKREFSGRFPVRFQTHPYNLNIDLSTILPNGELFPGEESNVAGEGKVSRERLAEIRALNAKNDRTNELIADYKKTLDARDWRHARDVLKELISLDPNRWEYYQNLGMLESGLGRYAEAAQAFDHSSKLAQKIVDSMPGAPDIEKDFSRLLIYEGDAYAHTGELDKAVTAYEKAAAMGVEPGLAYLHECNAQGNNGELEAAVGSCSRAVAAAPDEWEYYGMLANMENRLDKSEAAIQAYGKGIELLRKKLPSDQNQERAKAALGQMLTSEGYLYSRQHHFDQAISLFSEAADFSVYPAMPYFDLCATLFNVNRTAEAITACDKAIAADPKMADAYYVKALALFGQSKPEDNGFVVPAGTAEALKKYLELDPDGNHAQNAREMLKKIKAGG